MILTAEIKKELKARGININTFYKRIYRGNTIEQALHPVVGQGGNPHKLYTIQASNSKAKHKFNSAREVACFLTRQTKKNITKNMIVGRLYRNRKTVIFDYKITCEVVK